MTAKQWYRKFYDLYYRDRKILELDNSGKCDQEGLWTPAMMRLLRRMAKAYKCDAKEEGPVAGGGRSDQRWIKGRGSIVYVEHENRCDEKISGEIVKLCNDVSKLKVLITYVADRNFKTNVNQLKGKVQQAVNDHRATFTGELLLVVSGYRDNDWVAYTSVLKPEMRPVKL